MKGYIDSKLEDRFSSAQIAVEVNDKNVVVYNWPADLPCNDIKNYLESVCDGYLIQFNSLYQNGDTSCQNSQVEEDLFSKEPFEEGGFLPELNAFFPTMLAESHILGYSAGYRSYDKIFKSTLPVSIGDQFTLYQFKINSTARLYFGIEACVWAVFKAKTQSLSLINADYFIGLPLTYINDKFSARLRLFHESSHLGDEFLLETPKIKRVNPSMEGLDLSVAYEFMDKSVCFIGYTRIVRSDDSFKIKPNSVYYGFNYFLNFAKIQTFHVQATPYIAAYVINRQNNHWDFDYSLAIGYQWNKCYGRKIRVYLVGHDGYSAEGQFARKKAKYISINLLYGY
jgi:hypothetical protein